MLTTIPERIVQRRWRAGGGRHIMLKQIVCVCCGIVWYMWRHLFSSVTSCFLFTERWKQNYPSHLVAGD